jgi:hypothetical protein
MVGVSSPGSEGDVVKTVNSSTVRKDRKEETKSEVEKQGVKKIVKDVEKEFEVVVWLTALREIKAGEALKVSYLSQLCTPCTTRRDMLQQSFLFHCLCERCVKEGIEGPGSRPRSLQNRIKDPPPSSTSTVPPSPSYKTVYTTDLNSESCTKTELRRELDKIMRRIQDPGSASPLDTSSSSSGNNSMRGSQSGTVKATLTTAEMVDLMGLTERAFSNLPNTEGVKTTPRTTVSTSVQSEEEDDIYCIHDAGMLVLGAAMKSRNLGPGSPKDLGSDSMVDELIVKACKVVCDCWMLLDCEVSGGMRMRIKGEIEGRSYHSILCIPTPTS